MKIENIKIVEKQQKTHIRSRWYGSRGEVLESKANGIELGDRHCNTESDGRHSWRVVSGVHVVVVAELQQKVMVGSDNGESYLNDLRVLGRVSSLHEYIR